MESKITFYLITFVLCFVAGTLCMGTMEVLDLQMTEGRQAILIMIGSICVLAFIGWICAVSEHR